MMEMKEMMMTMNWYRYDFKCPIFIPPVFHPNVFFVNTSMNSHQIRISMPSQL